MRPRYWCVVPAAGVGKRMGSAIPKQYLPINDSTVIQQTLEKLANIHQLESIVLCLSPGDEWWPSLAFQADTLVEIAHGGAERCDSVLNGLNHLSEKAADDDWVLVHDVARPCVRIEDVQSLIKSASVHAVGGLLGMPVRDTMKRANDVGDVSETVCRENLWHALTPQMFRYGQLKKALLSAKEKNQLITDEASAIELLSMQPLLVEGHPDNIKITHPEDLALAAMFLKQQGENK